MANNILIYNAAIAGIIGGVKARRSTVNLPAILAAANQIDAAMPPGGDDVTEAHARLVRGICAGLFSRYSYVNLDARVIQRITGLVQALSPDILPEAALEGPAPDGQFRVSDIADGSQIGQTIIWDSSAWVPANVVMVSKVTGTTGGDGAHMKLTEHLEVNLNNTEYAHEPIDSQASFLDGGMPSSQQIRIRNGANGGYIAAGRNGFMLGIERVHWVLDAPHINPNWSKSFMTVNETTGPSSWTLRAAIRMDAIGVGFLYRGTHTGGSAIPGEPNSPHTLTTGLTQSQVISSLVSWALEMFGWRTS